MDKRMMTCAFNKAQYLLGDVVEIRLAHAVSPIDVKVYRLENVVSCSCRIEDDCILLEELPCGGYGVSIKTPEDVWEGAFDIVKDQREITRYGFLTDFSSGNADEQDVAWMRDLHINAVQFYDWMYRHDELLPPQKHYEDPMGRYTDLSVIAQKIDSCKQYGMRAFAYGAVYAATPDTYRKHPEWGMYTMDGKPMTFANWLYYMNVSADNGWSHHILEEYRKAISFGFSGIHMDTYGFPKHVWDHCGNPVDLADELAELINHASDTVRQEASSGGVIFNAVNNWPLEAVALTKQDSVYIEVWPPNDTYFDLYTLIREARICSQRSVILAAYLKPFLSEDVQAAERAYRLAWAVISAAGGTQLVLGEEKGVLRDSYYVNYAKLRPAFLPIVQKYCDFIVRYGDLLYNDNGTDISKTASGGINEDICFDSDSCQFSPDGKENTVWTIIRESHKKVTINLINLQGNDCRWNEPKRQPLQGEKIRIRLRLDRVVRGFYYASPDHDCLNAVELVCESRDTDQGRIYTIELPHVQYWTVVWAQLEG